MRCEEPLKLPPEIKVLDSSISTGLRTASVSLRIVFAGSICVASGIDCKKLSEHPIDITAVKEQKPHGILASLDIEMSRQGFGLIAFY